MKVLAAKFSELLFNMDKKYLYTFKIGSNEYQILKPTRKIRENSEDFHLCEINRLVKLGVMPLSAWQKKVNGKSEVTSDEERLSLGLIIKDIQKSSEILAQLNAILDEDKTAENHDQILEHEANLAILETRYQTYQQIESQAFDNTAEGRARDKLFTWLTAFLSYKNGEPIFRGNTLDEKLDFAETIEDLEIAQANQRIKVLIMAHSNGRCLKESDFAKLDAEIVELLKKSLSESEDSSKLDTAPDTEGQEPSLDGSIIEQNGTSTVVLAEIGGLVAPEENS